MGVLPEETGYPVTESVEAKESSGLSAAESLQEQGSQGDDGELIVVSCYSDFSNLAHGPKGTQARNSLYVFQLKHGMLTLLNVTGSSVVNPAFSRFLPEKNVLYTCTEDVENNGKVIAYQVCPSGEMEYIGEQDAGGKSTCFLTIDNEKKNMLIANYWDSTLSVLPLDPQTAKLGAIKAMYDPKEGRELKAKSGAHANHSNNDATTIAERQGDPHSHAIVLDPFVGCIAYVPDLGMDVIREFFYDKKTGNMVPLSVIRTGDPAKETMPHGPRYICFHQTIPVAYVINEISSTVAVYSVDVDLIKEISQDSPVDVQRLFAKDEERQTLKLIQLIRCIPEAFPAEFNTSGRICVHNSGDFVLVSNRGHESIAIFRVLRNVDCIGRLKPVDFYHTRGNTPRHFAFDSSGNYLIAANQDSDKLAVFYFDGLTGQIEFTGNDYIVPSPNFVCSCPLNENRKANAILNPSLYSLKVKNHEQAIYADVAKLKLCLNDALKEIAHLRNEIRSAREQKIESESE